METTTGLAGINWKQAWKGEAPLQTKEEVTGQEGSEQAAFRDKIFLSKADVGYAKLGLGLAGALVTRFTGLPLTVVALTAATGYDLTNSIGYQQGTLVDKAHAVPTFRAFQLGLAALGLATGGRSWDSLGFYSLATLAATRPLINRGIQLKEVPSNAAIKTWLGLPSQGR